MKKTTECEGSIRLMESICKSSNLIGHNDESFDEKIDRLSPELEKLASILTPSISKEGAFIFCKIVENIYRRTELEIDDIGKLLGERTVSVFNLINIQRYVDELVDTGFLLKGNYSYKKSSVYKIPSSIFNSILKGLPIKGESKRNLSNRAFLQKCKKIFLLHNEGEMTLDTVVDSILTLSEKNLHLPLPKLYDEENLDDAEFLFLLKMVIRYWSSSDHEPELYSLSNFCRYFSELNADGELVLVNLNSFQKNILSGDSILIKNNLVKEANGNWRNKDVYSLTAKSIDLFLDGVDVYQKDKSTNCELFKVINPENVMSEELFYNDGVKKELDSMTQYLRGDSLSRIMNRQHELGMSCNFSSMIFGESGTGKSAFVLELGRATSRAILNVTLSELKDSYFGESEKKIQKLFDVYGSIVQDVIKNGGDKEGNRIPILLINEVEGLMMQRNNLTETKSTDQTLRNSTNIILDNLDRFVGILFASTNNSEVLDSALSRRFPFKILVDKPTQETRKRIIQSRLGKYLSDGEIETLSTYPITGGNIKNVVNKFLNHYILNSTIPEMDMIKKWCEIEERGWNEKVNGRIGFELKGQI